MTRGPHRSAGSRPSSTSSALTRSSSASGSSRPAESAGVDEPVLVGLAPGRGAVEAGDRGQFDAPARSRSRGAPGAGSRPCRRHCRRARGRRALVHRPWVSPGTGRGGALERHEDRERRTVFDHVMHAQHRRPSHERDRVGGERAGKTPVDLGVDDPADERLAREPDQDRRAKSPEAVEIPDAGMVLLPRLAKADAGIEQDPAEGTPAPAARLSERSKKRSTSSRMSIAGSACSRLCMTTTAEPVSATASAMPGSRCSPQTSLMTQAPSRAASRATAALLVSMEIGASRSRQAPRAPEDAPQLLVLGNRNVAGPGRSPPTSMIAAPSATIALARTTAAAGRNGGRRRRTNPASR